MSNFHVGQKVVCIDADAGRGFHWVKGEELKAGQVYTIRSVHIGPTGDPNVWLEEVSRSDASKRAYGPRVGYNASRFRPVVERKTSIEVFRAMLNPSKQTVEA